MSNDVRNMKDICNLLHEVRRTGGYPPADIDAMITTAETIYHNMKEK